MIRSRLRVDVPLEGRIGRPIFLKVRCGAPGTGRWWPSAYSDPAAGRLSREFDYGTEPDEIQRQASAAFDQVVRWVLTRRSTDERGRAIPLTEEQAR